MGQTSSAPLSNTSQPVLASTPSTAQVAQEAILTTIVISGVVYYMYKLLTAPQPFSDYKQGDNKYLQYNDKTRYLDLCQHRKELGDVPKTWNLVHGLPQYSSSFSDNADALVAQLHKVNKSDFPQKNLVIGIIFKIQCIFKSLDKRWTILNKLAFSDWCNYREDGFEAMFFTDLAIWLSGELITRDVKKIETAEVLTKWINYCKKVQDEVFLFRNDPAKQYDPKYRLTSIIDSLEKLKSNVVKSCKASTFNDKIHELNMLFINITKSAFNFFFMLLNDVHREELLVDVLLNNNDGAKSNMALDPKYVKLLESYLCQCIIATLKETGITDNDFEGDSPFNFESIESFLIKNTSDYCDLSQTGLWRFARHHSYEIQMSDQLPSLFLKKDILYIKIDSNELHYCVQSPKDVKETGVISLDALNLQNQDSISLDQIKSKLTCILNITSKSHHTYQPESNAKSYLDKIIQLHRSLCMLSSVRQFILLTAKVGTGWGHAWVYGDGACVEHVENVLSIITHSFNDFNDKLTEFWRCFYTNDYALYHKHEDKIDRHTRLNKANELFSAFAKYKTELHTLKSGIETDAKNPENSNEHILECVDKLAGNMNVYSKVTGLKLKPVPELPSLNSIKDHIISPGISVMETGFFEKIPSAIKAETTSESPAKSVDLTLLPGKIHKVLADGNCFFHALSHELNRLNLETLTHLELRQCGIGYLKAYPPLLEQFIPENKTQDQYLLQMEKDGTWADGPIIEALAMQFCVQLNIFEQRPDRHEHDDEVHAYALNKGAKRGIIGLFLHGGHYDALELVNVANTVTPEVVSKASTVSEHITLISTPTTICIQNKTYTALDLVSKLLGASRDELHASSLHLNLEDQIITEPKPFNSNIQKYIYHNFLIPNIGIVSNPAWISWLRGVAPSKHAKLSDLHQRVKAAIGAIYKSTSGQVNTPTLLETSIIDILLYNEIKKAFDKHQFYNYKTEWSDPQFKITKTAESISLALDPLKLSITRDTINQFSGDLAKQSAEKDAKIAELTKENSAKDAELVAKDAELVSTKAELVSTKAELVSTKAELVSTKAELETVREALRVSENENALNKETIARMRTTFDAVARKSSPHSNQYSNAFFTQQFPEVTSSNSASESHDNNRCDA